MAVVIFTSTPYTCTAALLLRYYYVITTGNILLTLHYTTHTCTHAHMHYTTHTCTHALHYTYMHTCTTHTLRLNTYTMCTTRALHYVITPCTLCSTMQHDVAYNKHPTLTPH